ncbi:Ribulokinase [Frankliniella fusca]|uniref:Ribulokinase n=1 Tax=Frankliniella fusca TaxID=407009 RepID=A0AAE1HBY3_9NEOP|nr:Ribulokinase [Frankliniella fusca]
MYQERMSEKSPRGLLILLLLICHVLSRHVSLKLHQEIFTRLICTQLSYIAQFRTHNSRKHRESLEEDLSVKDQAVVLSDGENSEESTESTLQWSNRLRYRSANYFTLEGLESTPGSDDIDLYPDSLIKEELARFYLKLESVFILPSSTVQAIAEEIKVMTELIHYRLKRALQEELATLKLESDVVKSIVMKTFKRDTVFNVHHKHEDAEQLGTIHMRSKFWAEHYPFIDPKEERLGVDDTGKVRRAHSIPIRESLKVLLKDPKINSPVNFYFKVEKIRNSTKFWGLFKACLTNTGLPRSDRGMSAVTSDTARDSVLKACEGRTEEWVWRAAIRVQGTASLLGRGRGRPGRPVHDGKLAAFERLCHQLEVHDECQFTMADLVAMMPSEDSYSERYLAQLLKDKYKDRVLIHNTKNAEECEILSDFTDGTAFRDHCQAHDGPCLQILLFQDGFDFNPLGASSGLYKPVGFYYTLGNIPPMYRSKVDLIQLVYMILELDLKPTQEQELQDFDKLKAALRPVLDELKDLYDEGIDIDGQKIRVCLMFALGDSLGQHIIGGFVKNFSSSEFSCRFCPMSKTEFLENPFRTRLLRTKEEYNEYVTIAKRKWNKLRKDGLNARKKLLEQAKTKAEKVAKRCTAPSKRKGDLKGVISKDAYRKMCAVNFKGVKYRPSPLNTNTFHVISAQPPCLAHDLFEGHVKSVVAKILRYCIEKDWFDLKCLNRRNKSFKCLGSDARDAPTPLKTLDKFSGNACENWNLLRLLPFIIGDLMKDPLDPMWQLFLSIKQICEYVCAPPVQKSHDRSHEPWDIKECHGRHFPMEDNFPCSFCPLPCEGFYKGISTKVRR